MRDDGFEYGAVARLLHKSGTVEENEKSLTINNADEITVFIDMFAGGDGDEHLKTLRSKLENINESYETLLARHSKEHGELFLRMEIDLNAGENRNFSNEQLLLNGYSGNVPTATIERMFDYGRYLLVSSSRPGGLPAHL